MELIQVSGAAFQMGLSSEDAEKLQTLYGPTPFPFYREQPQHLVQVASFYIAQTPVTNAEYLEFVECGGYDQDEYWSALFQEEELDLHEERSRFVDQTDWPGPLSWSHGKYPTGTEDHPVSGVSWFEAQAYCHFKGFRLPSEQEWEFAARGTDGRLYPWGPVFDPECSGHAELRERATHPVDRFPRGASPFGLLAVVGNVAQWCEDRYQPYPGQQDQDYGPIDRVLRGEFYLGLPESLRATVRTPRSPSDRFFGLGFRCATSALG